MNTRAAIYARFSTDKQRDASIDDQFRECERVAKTAGLEVVSRFEDKGISAGTHQRPGYQAMLSEARAHNFDVLISEDISRLWRNRSEYGQRSAELEDLGVHLLTCVGDDTRRDGWGLVLQIKQAVAEQARREASYRTRRGLEGNALSGKPTGGRAYGYVPAGDSATGQIEVEPTEAAVVRRIFELYADGVSPRGISASLNDEAIPSPGSKWQRTERRHDSKWLASAIHGDVNRGTGMLNNKRYIGVITWGRSEWKRSAADSKNRRHKLLADGSAHERIEERLRIVSDDLWQRVKARQALQSHVSGGKVKAGLRRRRPGGGHPGKYLLSGMLKCAACQASFALSNGTRYQCSSHHQGGPAACEVSLSVPRQRVESVVMDCVENVLLDTRRLIDIEERYRASAAATVVVDHRPRLAELDREVRNISDAIAKGLLSDALAARLKAAEAERARLLAERSKPPAVPRMLSVEAIERRRADLLRRLAEGGDIARSVLRELFPNAIQLEPDELGRYLWAVFVDDFDACRISLLYNSREERLQANAAAMLAGFARLAEPARGVEINGSGGAQRANPAPIQLAAALV
jgi:site-specific DNA recombinase